MSSFDFSVPCITFVGVGPGDPSLLTLAAVEAIKSSTVVAYPIARPGDRGIAFEIVSSWIRKDQKLLPLVLPMILDRKLLKEAWRLASSQLAEAFSEGEKIGVLCEGDVSLFATSSYLLEALKVNHPHCLVQLVPGITSIAAAAAAGRWPLCLQNDQLLITPTPNEPKQLRMLCEEAATSMRVLALIKLGHRWEWVRPLLDDMGLLEGALFAQRVGFSDQKVMPAINISKSVRPYFSLLLLRQSWPDIMP